MLAPICWFILFPSTLNIPKCSNSQSCTRAEVRSSSLSPGLSHRWKGPDHYVKQSPTASQEARAGTGARNWTPAPPIYWLLGHAQCTHCYSIEGLSEETRNLPANDLLNLIIKQKKIAMTFALYWSALAGQLTPLAAKWLGLYVVL